MTTQANETPTTELEAVVAEYRRTIQDGIDTTKEILQFYAIGALVVRIDGKHLLTKGPRQAGADLLVNFWIQRLLKMLPNRTAYKTVMETIALKVSGDSGHEICRYHWNYSILPGFDHQVVEEGYYLAVWVYNDGQWQITAQAFSSADFELSNALDQLYPEYQFKER